MERQEIIMRLQGLLGVLTQNDLSSSADDHALAQAIHLLERRQAPASKNRPYSVLLVLPDYLANTFGEDTFLAFVEEENTHLAIIEAQQQAAAALAEDDLDKGEINPDDFFVSLVCEGHIKDLRG